LPDLILSKQGLSPSKKPQNTTFLNSLGCSSMLEEEQPCSYRNKQEEPGCGSNPADSNILFISGLL